MTRGGRTFRERFSTVGRRLAGAWPRFRARLGGALPSLQGLQGRLIVPYAILTMIIAMVGTYVITRLVTSSVRERFSNQLFEASRVVADGVVRLERDHLADLRLMTFTQGVGEALAENDVIRLSRLLTPLALNNAVEAVTVTDLVGGEVLTLVYDAETTELTALQGSDFSRFGPVADVLQGKVDSLGDKFSGILQTTYGPFLFTSGPVRIEGDQLSGALMVGTRLQTLVADLKTQALADIVILDPEGELLATTLAEPEEGYAALELPEAEIADLSLPRTRDLELYNREFQVVYASLLVRRHQIGAVGVVLPSSYIVSTEATSRNTFALIFSVGTGAVIALGYLLARSISNPILRLRDISQAVASGNLDQASGLARSDEIGDLASAFDTMTIRLRERTAEAARLYAETVRRNRELAEINQKLQEAQQQLIQSEKLAAVGQLTAGIVHDVKNPLAVIKGLAEELKEEPGVPTEARVHLDAIRANASRASAIVSDLLTFARQSTPQMMRRDMCEAVKACLRLTEYLTRKAKVNVVTDLPDRMVMVTYDAQQIEQVLINLITNAVQAMPDGGTLRVSMHEAGEALAVAVQDTGIGIPAENLSRIFDPFFTTKKEGEGTGLGLSVSYGIVSRHRGRLEVESRVGEGTTFTLLLPVEQETASVEAEAG